MSASTIRWGILGAGSIARQFASALGRVRSARLESVGSRTEEKARAFASEYGAARAHGSYEALARDEQVDIVYIATPHNLHAPNIALCLESGKAVLCEKPLTVNAAEAREVVGIARDRGLFLMEGMWTRFFPIMRRVRELVPKLGQIQSVSADFGFSASVDPTGRLFNPHLAGGALLDVGVYTVSFASMILGAPATISANRHIGQTGVDEQTSILLGYSQAVNALNSLNTRRVEGSPLLASALLTCGIRAATPMEATVVGENGWIRIESPFWKPDALTMSSGRKEKFPFKGNGFEFEIQEVCDCLLSGKTESEIMPLDESVQIIETMDEIRRQIGLQYPFEK